MGPLQFLSAIFRAFTLRLLRIYHRARARLTSTGNWQREWLLTPPQFRGSLARRLVDRGVLLGMTHRDLISALTTPDQRNAPPSTMPFAWYLGSRRSGANLMFPYEEFLIVRFGASDVVEDVEIVNLD